MPDLLLELRSEEIPARMQRKAAGDLRKMLTDALVDAGLTYEGAQEYWTPRRLVLDVRGLTARSRDVREEIRGPSVKAPEAAIQGFLRKAGLQSIEQAHVHADPKKGDFFVAHKVTAGRGAEAIIAEAVPRIVRDFPWPKSMRWGAASARAGALRWVRPLQSILCTFGPETEDPVVVDFSIGEVRSGNTTVGHRFHAPGPITVKRFDDYAAKLEAAFVVLSGERRKSIIQADAENLAFASGLDLVADPALLEEVSGLVEWPVVLMGEFDEAFLEIPPEVIRLTIRANQKCFVTRPGGQADALSPRFLLTANIEAVDGGAEIARGNGKVVRARLSDALYFWRTDQGDLPDLGTLAASAEKFGLDLKKPLDQRTARLDHLNVTFHAKLGTQGERVERIRRLAREIAPLVGADPDLAARAAVLAKADLQTEVVGEFPELQGAMGRKYAALQGEHPSVAAAIEEHYKPQGPSDGVPSDPVSIAVALADKLDTLVGFWAIDEKPTGSKDPFALRRAALGVIRVVLESGISMRTTALLADQLEVLANQIADAGRAAIIYPDGDGTIIVKRSRDRILSDVDGYFRFDRKVIADGLARGQFAIAEDAFAVGKLQWGRKDYIVINLIEFLNDRLKVYLRDQGARHDLIDAVLAAGSPSPLMGGDRGGGSGGEVGAPTPYALPLMGEGVASVALDEKKASENDDLLSIVRRVEALGRLLATDDGRNLLAGTKRAVNILAAEEKKGTAVAPGVDPALLRDEAESALFDAVNRAEAAAAQAIRAEDFSAAMLALAGLRAPVDRFFEQVLVNDEDVAVRANRLALLARIRTATGQVADFSKIAG